MFPDHTVDMRLKTFRGEFILKSIKLSASIIMILLVLLLPTSALAHHEPGHFEVGAVEEKSKPIDMAPNAKSALLMDADTGTIIYEKNSHERLAPASITKIMTMLLIMESLEREEIKLNEKVTVSEYAASMGGSQIFLQVGEQMTVEDMLKGIAMASANDASVALAEKITGSEEMFIARMNERSEQLGMKNTHFSNTNGLPAKDHYSSAHDIAIMSKELLKHPSITKYTGKYQDYLRNDTDSPFWLVNTNKLVRFYQGADGLKTGYTSEAQFCLSATAIKDSFRVIAVVLGEPNTKTRNAEVSQLFNFAFSQFTNMPIYQAGDNMGTVKVEKGDVEKVQLTAKHRYSVLLKKGEKKTDIHHEIKFDPDLKAPIAIGQPIGKLIVYKGDNAIAEFTVESPTAVNRAGWWTLLKRTTGKLFFLD
jgi:D-alanyl-D-alanine carboxypeptidase (penicillin-binding protein 5/6)